MAAKVTSDRLRVATVSGSAQVRVCSEMAVSSPFRHTRPSFAYNVGPAKITAVVRMIAC